MASQEARRVGANLRRYRKQRDLTQRQLADRVDANSFEVSRWERGAHLPSDVNLARLADALGVTEADLHNSKGATA